MSSKLQSRYCSLLNLCPASPMQKLRLGFMQPWKLLYCDWYRTVHIEWEHISHLWEDRHCPSKPTSHNLVEDTTAEYKYSRTACLTPHHLKIHTHRGHIQMLSLREDICFCFHLSTLTWIGNDEFFIWQGRSKHLTLTPWASSTGGGEWIGKMLNVNKVSWGCVLYF